MDAESAVMTRYSLLVSLHVASVIVWLGSGTTLVFVAIYAQRARDGVVLDQLGVLVQWMALRVFAPAALAAFVFGVAAAHEGHWPDLFWFHVGEGAFAFWWCRWGAAPDAGTVSRGLQRPR
jgi:uncharacterized membrane protein